MRSLRSFITSEAPRLRSFISSETTRVRSLRGNEAPQARRLKPKNGTPLPYYKNASILGFGIDLLIKRTLRRSAPRSWRGCTYRHVLPCQYHGLVQWVVELVVILAPTLTEICVLVVLSFRAYLYGSRAVPRDHGLEVERWTRAARSATTAAATATTGHMEAVTLYGEITIRSPPDARVRMFSLLRHRRQFLEGCLPSPPWSPWSWRAMC